jgi:hypothetical protein
MQGVMKPGMAYAHSHPIPLSHGNREHRGDYLS